ncbi:MAG TPA: HesA/MoeB/ThiF family protein [Bacteroidia bacterium]|nr:HesA/MoeB/ThiF family protein [Bacteroidia bacterium]
MNRFDRQVILKEFGEVKQWKLTNASVLVIGAGGLGCPAILYLAAAGIGKIGIVDGDLIHISNLNRQIIYQENDIGKSKSLVATQHVKQKYQDISVEAFDTFLNNKNALTIIEKYDVVLDCCDNFSTRYMINDACVILNKPLIYGAIYSYEGQISVFNFMNERGEIFTYRDLFPNPPQPSQFPDCNSTGVLGVVPGIIGTMQAAETIKVISGIGKTLAGEILYYNLLQQDFYKIEISSAQNEIIKTPKNKNEFAHYDYENSCHSSSLLDWNEAEIIFANDKKNSIFIDVRELNELPKIKSVDCFELPLSQFNELEEILPNKNNLLVFCLSGTRSIKAIQLIKKKFPNKNVYSINGGIMSSLSPINKTLNNVNS